MKEEDIKGTRGAANGLLLMAYTCGKCEHKQVRTFSRKSYEEGVVLVRCENCDSLHLIADNLGWFEDQKVNIQQIMERQGSQVHTNVTDQAVEIDRIPFHGAADADMSSSEQFEESQQSDAPKPSSVALSPAASHSMMINYAVAHEAQARDAMGRVEKIWPGQFNFYLFAEGELESDRLDVTVFAGQTELTGAMMGTLVHSRDQSGTFVEEEPVSFLTYIERALENS